ncbi:MAG: transporter substrate-binding domain-containing protein [Campylobacterales bacterium]|nr:transporter substrate-binding domain-containing protein [Campylobacterales bacterium]
MKPLLFILFLFCYFSLPLSIHARADFLTQEEREYISKYPILRVSNDTQQYPYSFYGSYQPQGYVVDFLRLLASRLELDIQFVSNTSQSLAHLFHEGHLDILAPTLSSFLEEESALLSDAILNIQYALITRTNAPLSLQSLAGKNLALSQEYGKTEVIQKRYPESNFLIFDSPKEALEAVAFGLADGAIEDFIVACYIMNRYMLANLNVVRLREPHLNDTLHLALNPEASPLQRILNKTIRTIKEEELYALRSKWFHAIQSDRLATLDLTFDEKHHLEKLGTIRLCIDPNAMPLEGSQEGKHVGMSSDYMHLIEEILGVPIHMIPTRSWAESLEKVKTRQCDMVSLAMPTPERRLYLRFTKPYLTIPLVLVTRPEEIFFSDVSTIYNRPIGIVKGYSHGEILRVKYPKMHFVEVKDVHEGLSKVHKKELFGFVDSLPILGSIIQKEFATQLKIAGKFDESWELGLGVRNDDPHLFTILEKAVASIDVDVHQEILNKWISVRYERGVDYGFLLKVLGAFALFVLYLLFRQRELSRHNHQLVLLSATDVLTGIYNRMKLDELLSQEYNYFLRYKRDLSLIIIDIDNFKKVNDTFGHKVGDAVLVRFTQIITQEKRTTDIFGRWGGEEFLLICKETDANGAEILAEKIKATLKRTEFEHVGHKTASYGITQFKEGDTIESAFIRADKALYCAKSKGKNRICTF